MSHSPLEWEMRRLFMKYFQNISSWIHFTQLYDYDFICKPIIGEKDQV